MQVKTAAFTLAAALFALSHGAVIAAQRRSQPKPRPPVLTSRLARKTTSTPFTTCAAEPTRGATTRGSSERLESRCCCTHGPPARATRTLGPALPARA